MRLRLVLPATGLALGLFTLAVARSGAGFSLALTTTFGAVALLAGGWSLMVAGLAIGFGRRPIAMSLLLYGTGFAWFAAEWDNPATGSAVVFSLGVALYTVCPAFVVHLALAYPSGRLGSPAARVVVVAGYAITVGVLGMASALVYSPAAHGCAECASNLLLVTDRPALWVELNRWGVRLAAAWAVAALGALVWRLLRASRASRHAFGLVSGCAIGYTTSVLVYYLGSLQRGFLGGNARDGELWLLQASALVLLSLAVLADLVQARLTHRALTKLVVDLVGTTPTGHLRDAMATRLGDPDLVIGYPIEEGGRFVDAAARDVDVPPTDGRAMTALRYRGRDEAVLVHRPGLLGSPETVEDLVSAVHLGLENEHLQAEALAQLADLRSSGARIVAEGDEERRRLERDLHDGAQQRLVGLSLALRLLRSQLSTPQPELDAADGELQKAIAELRRLARGLYPVVLRDQGLAAALHALAESRHLRVESAPSGRLPDVVESTAYILIARVSECGRTTVEVVDADRLLVVDATVEAHVADLGDIADRVRTLAGSLEVTHPDGGATLIRLRLPVDRS